MCAISSDATVVGRQTAHCLSVLEMKTRGFGLNNYMFEFIFLVKLVKKSLKC